MDNSIGESNDTMKPNDVTIERDEGSNSSLSSILDLSGVDLDNDETWLYTPKTEEAPKATPVEKPQPLRSVNVVDTRTFTRPKKKYTRPSIDQIYTSNNGDIASSCEDKAAPAGRRMITEKLQEEPEPATTTAIQFDLSKPVDSNYFDGSANKSSLFSLSPPSLMCSSTFANLMENSLILNDPVLSEISTKDFTEQALLQDMEAPMFQSLTESCSSRTSDTPEGFLRRVTKGEMSFVKESMEDANKTLAIEPVDTPPTSAVLNGTYKRTPRKHSETFSKADMKNHRRNFTRSKDDHTHNFSGYAVNNNTYNKESLEDLRLIYRTDCTEADTELNRLEKSDTMKLAYKDDSKSSCLGSADSLDHTSSASSGSRRSSKVISLEDVRAAAQLQEKCLSEVMSTPMAKRPEMAHLWNDCRISPIALSDSNLSQHTDSPHSNRSSHTFAKSSDNLDTPKRRITCPKTLHSNNTSLTRRSVLLRNNLGSCDDVRLQKTIIGDDTKPKIAGSRLRNATGFGGSQQNLLSRPSQSNSPTNLRTMGPRLKSSYTSLKPVNAMLPVAPPVGDTGNVTITKGARNIPTAVGDSTFVRPQAMMAPPSGVPRPTGIPRFTASRIPGPRGRSNR